MSFFSSENRKRKMLLLLLLLAMGPVSGLALGPEMRMFFRDLDWGASRIPVSFMEVISVSPGVFVLFDGYEVMFVSAPARQLGKSAAPGDVLSGELERNRWGYQLIWSRIHRYREGKHIVSLLPVGAVALWLALRLRFAGGVLSLKDEAVSGR